MVFNISESDERITIDPETLPYKIVKLEDVVIKMKDGCKLRAHIWLPQEAVEGKMKVGTIIEYLPYRKNDFTAIRDSIRHPYYAGNGFASMRIDMRGCGDSDDVILGEYLQQEQDDCLECFDWVIDQEWSNGNIGMVGKSWGGFNGLQLAYRQHPALKTIITLMSTDDRYSDDVHYRGGCLLASDMLWWASTMFAYNARPQDPQIVGDSWRETWLERIKLDPNVIEWVSHQTRDDFWKHGSVCEDYNKVDIPVLAIGGWRDGYTTPVFRMCENLPNDQSACIVGPWVHEFPEVATPSPAIGYGELAIDWWTTHLTPEKGVKLELPKLTAYIQEPCGIEESYTFRPGKWISTNFDKKPELVFGLSKDLKLLKEKKHTDIQVSFTGSQEHGLFRGVWCPFGQDGDFPADQRIEDAKCISFDSELFEEDVELLGEPKFNTSISSDKPLANLSVRLTDIYPSGESVLISWGMLNLSHRNSHEFPEALEVGKVYDISVKLDVLGLKIEKGHKLRLSLSPTDWPQCWPLAETPTLTLHSAELVLPLVDKSDLVTPPQFSQPASLAACEREVLREESRSRKYVYDVINNTWTIDDFSDEGSRRLPSIGTANGIEMGSWNKNTWSIKAGDPLSAYNQCDWELVVGRGDWQIKLLTTSTMKADKNNFLLYNKLEAFENEQKVHEQVWENKIPRNFI